MHLTSVSEIVDFNPIGNNIAIGLTRRVGLIHLGCPMSKDLLLSPPNSRMTSGVVKRLEQEIRDEEAPLITKFVTWLNLLKFVAEGEALLLEDESNPELRQCHRSILESSIVLGELLLSEKGISEVLTELKVTVADFESKLRMLRYKDRMWHGDLSSEKSEQVLASVFGELPRTLSEDS